MKNSNNTTDENSVIKEQHCESADSVTAKNTSEPNDKLDTAVKKKSAVPVIAISAAAVLIIAAILIVVVLSAKSFGEKKRITDHLALGERYLSEMDYDQAIAAYLAVIEIDPNNKEAYEGLANTYMAQADALADSGDKENAIVILENAFAQMSSMQNTDNAADLESLTEKINEKTEELQNELNAEQEELLRAEEEAEQAEKGHDDSEATAEENESEETDAEDADTEEAVSENEADTTVSENETAAAEYKTLSCAFTGYDNSNFNDPQAISTFNGISVLKNKGEMLDENSTFTVTDLNGATPDYFYVIGITTDCGMFNYDECPEWNPEYQHLSAGFLPYYYSGNINDLLNMGITDANQFYFYAEPFTPGKTYSVCPKGCSEFLTKTQNSNKLKSFYWGVMWFNGDNDEIGWGNGDATTYGWFSMDGSGKIY